MLHTAAWAAAEYVPLRY